MFFSSLFYTIIFYVFLDFEYLIFMPKVVRVFFIGAKFNPCFLIRAHEVTAILLIEYFSNLL